MMILNEKEKLFLVLVVLVLVVVTTHIINGDPLPMGKDDQGMMVSYEERDQVAVAYRNAEWKANRACKQMKAWGYNWEVCNKGMLEFFLKEREDYLAYQQSDLEVPATLQPSKQRGRY